MIASLLRYAMVLTLLLASARASLAGEVIGRKHAGYPGVWETVEGKRLIGIRVSKGSLDAKVLSLIAAARHLESLDLDGTSLTDTHMGRLPKCESMRALRLVGTAIGAEGLRMVVAKYPHLRSLDVSGTKVAEALASLSSLARLQSLKVDRVPGVEAHLLSIARIPKLVSVSAVGTLAGDKLAAALARHATLVDLDLSGTRVGRVGIQELSKAGRLEYLQIESLDVEDDDLVALSGLAKLIDLSLPSSAGPRCLSSLASVPELRGLDMHGASLTPAVVDAVAKLKALRHLDVSGGRLRPDAVAHLGKLSQLVSLDLGAVHLSSEAVDAVAGLSQLYGLFLRDSAIGDEVVLRLAKGNRKLGILCLGGTRVTDGVVDCLLSWKTLEVVRLRKGQLSADALAKLGTHKSLKIMLE